MKINLSDGRSVKAVIAKLNRAARILEQKTADVNQSIADEAANSIRSRLPPDADIRTVQLPDGRYRIIASGDSVIRSEFGIGISNRQMPFDEMNVPDVEPYIMYRTGKEIRKRLNDEARRITSHILQ